MTKIEVEELKWKVALSPFAAASTHRGMRAVRTFAFCKVQYYDMIPFSDEFQLTAV